MLALASVALFAIGGVGANVGALAPERVIGAVDGSFHVDSVQPTPSSPLGRARQARETDGVESALRIARAALTDTSGHEKAELAFFIGRLEKSRGQTRAALDAFAQAAAIEDPLAALAHLERAELLTDRPLDLLREVATLTSEVWTGQRRARELEAVAYARLSRWDEAVPRLRALVTSAPVRSAAYTVAAPLADWLAQQESEEARTEAIALYRRIATRVPATSLATSAEEKAARTLASLPTARRQAAAATSIEDAFVRADVFFDGMRHQEAEEAYAQIAARADVSSEDRCRALLRQGQTLVRRRARAEGVSLLARVTHDCTVEDTRAWALFSSGKAAVSLGHRDEARGSFLALVQEAPAHRLADDALYRAALVSYDSGDEAGAEASLRTLVSRYTSGDMRGEARFRLAWAARKAGRFADALRELEASIAEGTMESAEDIQGRAAYWRARSLDDLNRRSDATAAYEDLVRARPLTFYGQEAWARLRERDEARARSLRTELLAPQSAELPLTFPTRPEMSTDAFARAVSLLRIGDPTRAREELSSLGFLRDDSDLDAVWLTAAMLAKAGDVSTSTNLARRRLLSYLATQPTERQRSLWRVAYPLAHAPLVEEAGAEVGVPPALIRAIAREESNFDTHAVSAVGAHGMIQLMPGTARRFAQPLGLRFDTASLERPEINLRVGGAFLRFLLTRYEARPGFVPAAYNAGEGATDRWRRERPDVAFDVWVEEIPYEETRRYTRRVLQSYGVYAALAGEELPRF